MSHVINFEWALKVADAEQIADAARAEGASEGLAQLIEQNVLLHPGMVATLRDRLRWDDVRIAKAMMDPHGFAEEVLADAEAFTGEDLREGLPE